MKQRNQARVFEAEESNFEPPKNLSSKNQTQEKNLSLGEAIEDFKLRGKVEGRAEKTLEQYDYVFNRLLEQFPGESKVKEMEAREIRKYLSRLMDEGLKKTSVAIHYRNLNSLFNWLKSEGHIEKSPMKKIKEPKTPDVFPKVLNTQFFSPI